MQVGRCVLDPVYSGHIGTRGDCPDNLSVLVSRVKAVLWQNTVNHLVPVTCVHSTEGCNSGVWIRGAPLYTIEYLLCSPCFVSSVDSSQGSFVYRWEKCTRFSGYSD